jgi:hypothetical protein
MNFGGAMNKSGLATGELKRIFNPIQTAVREVVEDEADIKICHGCGEIDTPEYCLCTAEQKAELAQIESH